MTAVATGVGPGRLPQTARQERYGISYLSDVCAEAGTGMMETRPGEDHYAIDAYVRLSRGIVSVQVKCTTKDFTVRAPQHISWPIEQAWWDKWLEDSAPVFLLLVRVPEADDPWVDFEQDDVTTHRTAAYWVEVDKTLAAAPTSVTFPRFQRFTRETFIEWDEIHKRGLGLA